MQDQLILFFKWLVDLIRTEEIDLLLISGDIFDYANPAAEDRKLYYSFLKQLVDSNTKIIITGGNHDSAGFLNAPKDILQELDVSVVGEATPILEDELIVVKDAQGKDALVIAAVPFLKDKDLRNREIDVNYESRIEAIRGGIKNHYARLSTLCEQKYPELPSIAMGHLYAVGANPSESEREIQMGNQAAIDASVFGSQFGYVALGHIHRPQIVAKSEFIRYSGSPIPLSFSEKKDIKSVVLLSLEGANFGQPQIIKVPPTRALDKITGTLEEVAQKLESYQKTLDLPSFLEIAVTEDEYSSTKISSFDELKQEYADSEEFKIIKATLTWRKDRAQMSNLFEDSKGIEELKPIEVFTKKLESEQIEGEIATSLKEAFQELLETVQNED